MSIRFEKAAIAAAFLSLLIPASAQAAGSSVGVAVTPARLEFKIPAGVTELEASFQVANRGSDRVTVEITLVDVVIDKAGTWQLLPAGSTPYTFPATFAPATLTLGVGEAATVKVAAHVGSRPLMGGVLVHPVAPTTSGSAGSVSLHVNPDILVPLLAAPVDGSGVVEGVELSGKAAGITLPMFVEHGPVAVTSSVENTAKFYERAWTTVEYAAWGHTYLTIALPPVGTFPGGTARSSATSIVHTDQAGDLDVTPWLGLVKVTTTTHLTLLDSSAPPIVQTAWVVVAPVRLLLGLLWLIAGVTLAGRLSRRYAR